ncbi:sensor histidine kinase [Streptomyces uncialis]|uniref:sensor histidine kinase n=1 Tax=Streptomyces uncialis TaxID=1048205 RepID=UPI003866115A|nr:histidine kinase [Streptomyces uncialis]
MNGEVDHAVDTADAHCCAVSARRKEGPASADPLLAPTVMPAPRTARAITAFALCSLGAIAFMNVYWTGATSGQYAVCLAFALAAIGVSFLITTPKAPCWPASHRWLALGVQAVATHLPFAFFGFSWGSMGGPLAGAVLYLLPMRAAAPVFGVIVSAQVGMGLFAGHSLLRTIYLGLVTAYIGMFLYALARLTSLVVWLDASRAERAYAAVTRERLRFARDLHDLLGYSLSAITLKAELVHRLLPDRPERAGEEVGDVLTVARQALADVRLVASGYRDLTVESEMASGTSILATAEVRTLTTVDCGPLHPVVDTVLATVLREGITNILRHSTAREVGITVTRYDGTVRLTLVNDGVRGGATVEATGTRGSGLGNLRHRLESIGGSFRAGVGADGRFVLRAQAPVDPVGVRPADDHLSLGVPS